MSNELNFDTTPTRLPVKIDGVEYTLQEANGKAACIYRNTMLKCSKLGPSGKVSSVEGLADVEPLLVSLCLFDSANNPVSLEKVLSWPSRIIKPLFENAKQISELEEEDEDKAKNEQSDTTDG